MSAFAARTRNDLVPRPSSLDGDEVAEHENGDDLVLSANHFEEKAA